MSTHAESILNIEEGFGKPIVDHVRTGIGVDMQGMTVRLPSEQHAASARSQDAADLVRLIPEVVDLAADSSVVLHRPAGTGKPSQEN